MAKSGDIIGFSGSSLVSDVVNLATLGVPRWSISHVGVMAEYKGELLLFESTTLDDIPCVIRGKSFKGVKAHRLSDVLARYAGRAYEFPLVRPLYPFESDRLTDFLVSKIGVPYDEVGAMRSAGLALSWIESLMHSECLAMMFCSELVAKAYSEIGLHPTENAARWNPNHLVRHLVWQEIVLRPHRIR